MITIKIDEKTLLDMLMDRVSFWTDNLTKQELFEAYYRNLIEDGFFENHELDVISMVDNDYINDLIIIGKEDFKQYNEGDYKIVASNKEDNLYLILCN